jgi:hypothetical protein
MSEEKTVGFETTPEPEKKMSKLKRIGFDEKYLVIITIIIAGVLGYFAQVLSGSNLQIVTTKFINLTLLVIASFAIIKFTRGTKYDVLREIFVEGNIAAAVYLGMFILACSISITVNS